MKFKVVFYIIIIFFLTTTLSSCAAKRLFCKHQYDIITNDSTCTSYGKRTYLCKWCGKNYFDIILKKEHEYHNYHITKEPNCIEKGLIEGICKHCNKEITLLIPKIGHDFIEEIHNPTCKEHGYTLVKCNYCNYNDTKDYVDMIEHEFGDWKPIIESSIVNDGLEEHTCLVCNYNEQRIIESTTYVNLDLIKLDYNFENEYLEVSSIDEFQQVFDFAILNEIEYFEVEYLLEEQRSILNYLVDNSSIDSACEIELNKRNNRYKFEVEYYSKPINKSNSEDSFIQFNSANKSHYTSNRPTDFDEFKINESLYTFEVSTSEQLFYCLERRVLPICKENSEAELIFMEAKKVLREIIDDNMNDFEKIKAIHDWIILNVTYDDNLYNLANSSEENINDYRGFFLEGVFIDKKAVCDGISKAFVVLTNIEGIPSVQVEGYQVNKLNNSKHAWNKVYLNKNWYIVDTTSDGMILNDTIEILSYDYFLISNEQMNKYYIEESFTNIYCENKNNVYELMNYSYLDYNYSLVIDDMDELLMIISYFESIEENNYSLQFYINFDFGDSIIDEITNVYTQLNLPVIPSYIVNNQVVTLIRQGG